MGRLTHYIGKWAEKSMITYKLFNSYVRFRQRINARKDPRELANNDYYRTFKKNIDWNNPKNIIEKIFWLQLFTDTSLWSICADKYRVREYVRSKGLEHLLPKLYGRWFDSKDIDFEKLPNSFVLKTTNGCGQVLVVKDKRELDIEETRFLLDKWMMLRYGYDDAQIHYTRIRPCIIAEEYLEDKSSQNESKSIVDYKVWCLNGNVEYILCVFDRVILGENKGYKLAAYDRDWNNISSECLNPDEVENVEIKRPKHLDEMIRYAESLSKDFVEVRVDFYDTDERAYLGELTFTTGYGYHKEEFYEYLGSKIDLSKVKRIDGMNRPDMTKF